jgi:hypothetical protein
VVDDDALARAGRRHTNTAANPLDATELVVASQQILHDPQHPSRIHLTVVPDDAP